MPSTRTRGLALLVVTLCVLTLTQSYLAAGSVAQAGPNGTVGVEERINGTDVETTHALTAADHVTVVATQGFYISDETAELVAFTGDGEIAYYNDSYRVYFDVDPVDNRTVEYVAAQHFSGEPCAEFDPYHCTKNVVERVNLTTGDTEVVYAELTPRVYSARWHDVDRVNDTHLAVADIVEDRVYVVDTRTKEITWQWNATEDFSRDSGGDTGDWTHVNDVEVLDDGRIMVSLRNQDQVVFLEPGGDLNESWTLGADGAHEILYEQHNPDYLPAENGGPAILVADSENGRLVEYQRRGSGWERTWTWRDARLQWPRDADRLPSGNTLVVDSHGDRVLEVTPNGSVAWNVSIGMPYDAERLGTGDESTGGPARAAMDAAGGRNAGPVDTAVLAIKDVTPPLVVNGLLYVSPSWVRFTDLLVAAAGLVTLLGWTGAELHAAGVVGRLRAAVAGLRR